MNDKATALKYYEKGLKLDPNDQQIKENLNSLKK
jgi:hypothetical protein